MMWLLLEALGAALILIGIVWWTMFSGRKDGELPQTQDLQDARDAQKPPQSAPVSQKNGPASTPDNFGQ